MATAKKPTAIERDAKAVADLRADFAALSAATEPKDRSKIWWSYLGLVSERRRVARVRAVLRKKLPFGDEDLAEMLATTARIQNGEGGLASNDPAGALLKATERALAGRKPEGKLRKALERVKRNLNAANAPVQRLRKQVEAMLA